MDQHFLGGSDGRCTSRNIRTFARGFETPAWGLEVLDDGLGVPTWPVWSLEVAEDGFGPPTWDPNVFEGVRGDTKFSEPARADAPATDCWLPSDNPDILAVPGKSLAGRLFLSGNLEELIRSSSSLATLFNDLADLPDVLAATCTLSLATCLRVSLDSIIISYHG